MEYLLTNTDYIPNSSHIANNICEGGIDDISASDDQTEHKSTTNALTPHPQDTKENQTHSQYFFDIADGLFTPIDDQFLSNRKHKKIKEELVNDSGISPDQLKLNFFYVDSLSKIKELINWKNYTYAPGWVHVAVMPDGESDTRISCFKPNSAVIFDKVNKDGEPEQEILKYVNRANDTLDESDPEYKEKERQQKIESTRPQLPRIAVSSFEKMRVNFPGLFDGYTLIESVEGEAVGLWEYIKNNPKIPKIPAEGMKKANALISAGYPAIGITGCHMAQILEDPTTKRHGLGPWYRDWCISGSSIWYQAYDGDNLNNLNVASALLKSSFCLKNQGKQKVFILSWEGYKDKNGEQCKGIDDVIGCYGPEVVTEIISKAVAFDKWLSLHPLKNNGLNDLLRFEKSNVIPREEEPEPPSHSVIAEEIAELYKDQLLYISDSKKWYRYNEGIWEKQHADFISRDIIQPYLKDKTIEYSLSYLSGIQGVLKDKIACSHLDQISGKIPFTNGCLDLNTMVLEEHKPENFLTWCLPYDYQPEKTCGPIKDWLKLAVTYDDQVQLLRAFLAAIVRGKVELQRYLELQGPGQTGKSTFMNLAISLIGLKNTYATRLQRLENNRFELASLKGKKLVTIADSDKYGGDVSILKQYTGQDPLYYEEKNVQPEDPFYAEGLVIITCNEPIQSSDYSSGLTRRRITVMMSKVIEDEAVETLIEINNKGPKPVLQGRFAPYIPGLLNWVLAMPEDEIFNYVKLTKKYVPSLSPSILQSVSDTNPMAQWADQFLIINPEEKTQVGSANRQKDAGDPHTYMNWDEWLYASYAEWAVGVNHKVVAQNKFSNSLLDLLKNTLKLKFVSAERNSKGRFVSGVRLRGEFDVLTPLLMTGLDNQLNHIDPATGRKLIDNPTGEPGTLANAELQKQGESKTAETLTNAELDGCADRGVSETLVNAELDGNAELLKTYTYRENNNNDVGIDHDHDLHDDHAHTYIRVLESPSSSPSSALPVIPATTLPALPPKVQHSSELARVTADSVPETAPEPAPKAELPEAVVNNPGESLEELTDHYRLFLKTVWLDQAEYSDDPATTKLYEFKSKLVIPRDLDKFDVSAYLGEVRSEPDQFPNLFPELAELLESADPEKEMVQVLIKELSTAHSITNSTQLKKHIRTISTKPGKWIDAISKNCKKGK